MTDALQVEHLNKDFKHFSLKDISFSVRQGQVVGLIGENGSGKSTTIRCILGQDIPASGTVSVYGENALNDPAIHNRIGAASDAAPFPEQLNARQLSSVFQDIFADWQADHFFRFLEHFDVPLERQTRHLSRGMKAKLNLAAALSHKASLLLLDEATAGLDPVVRDEILDQLRAFMEDETHAILMTSHITSDLERIADVILYIRDGQILFEIERAELEQYGMARLRQNETEFLDENLLIAKRKSDLYTEVLVRNRDEFSRRYPDYVIDPVSLDEIIVMLSRGGMK